MTISSLNVTIDDLVIDHAALYETIRKSFTRDPFEHYVNGMCGLFICILGIVSNALKFFYSYSSNNATFNLCLFSWFMFK